MADWKSRLQQADPGRNAVMPHADVQRIRRMLVSTAAAGPAAGWTARPRTYAATVTRQIILWVSALAVLCRLAPRSRPHRTVSAEPAPGKAPARPPGRVWVKRLPTARRLFEAGTRR